MIEAYASHPELFDRYVAAWGAPTEDLWVRRGDDGFHVLTTIKVSMPTRR